MTTMGLVGVGQSSWGPTLYGFSEADPADRSRILETLRRRLPPTTDVRGWTESASRGALASLID